jgi:hypothetical protein
VRKEKTKVKDGFLSISPAPTREAEGTFGLGQRDLSFSHFDQLSGGFANQVYHS